MAETRDMSAVNFAALDPRDLLSDCTGPPDTFALRDSLAESMLKDGTVESLDQGKFVASVVYTKWDDDSAHAFMMAIGIMAGANLDPVDTTTEAFREQYKREMQSFHLSRAGPMGSA